jgi:hypothetical protein
MLALTLTLDMAFLAAEEVTMEYELELEDWENPHQHQGVQLDVQTL